MAKNMSWKLSWLRALSGLSINLASGWYGARKKSQSMNTTGLWTINANIQLLTGVVLVVVLLLYVAYRLTVRR